MGLCFLGFISKPRLKKETAAAEALARRSRLAMNDNDPDPKDAEIARLREALAELVVQIRRGEGVDNMRTNGVPTSS
jgi:hypothetical protein